MRRKATTLTVEKDITIRSLPNPSSIRKSKLSKKKRNFYCFMISFSIIVIVLLSCYFSTNRIVNIIDSLLSIFDESIEKTSLESNMQQSLNSLVMKKVPPPVIDNIMNISRNNIAVLSWGINITSIDSIIESQVPVIIKNFTIQHWAMFDKKQWSFVKFLQEKGNLIELNETRWQQKDSTFILGYERDRGGMLGSVHDRPLRLTNITLTEFLDSILDDELYLYWTGELKTFEAMAGFTTPVTGTLVHNFTDGWQSFRIIDHGLESSISLEDDGSLWKPMLWLSHPGVVAQTHYDTQHNIFLQISGQKKFFLFPHDSELYCYPNIHRSYRQSQVLLTPSLTAYTTNELLTKFPEIQRNLGIEVTVSPGDILYIPPYYYHRVESHTISMSLSVLSPSMIEAALAQVYWSQVPFGKFQDNPTYRIKAVVRYLELILKNAKFRDSTMESFSNRLYQTRFEPLYSRKYIREMFRDDARYRGICDILQNSNDVTTIEDETIEVAHKEKEEEEDRVLIDLLESTKKDFEDAAQKFASSLQSVDKRNISLAIKETFFKDYFEQLIRWAVGPDKVAVFIYKCLAKLS